METVIKDVLNEVNNFLLAIKVNVWYVLLWVAAGFVQKQYFSSVTRLSETWKTLILGSFFSVVYAILLRDTGNKETWVEFCASYLFATSLYELFLKKLSYWLVNAVEKKYRKLLGIEDEKIEKIVEVKEKVEQVIKQEKADQKTDHIEQIIQETEKRE